MADVAKHLEKAKKYLEKNKLQDAIEHYLAVVAAEPAHAEALQALGDLFYRQGDTARAAQYYGRMFDRYIESGEANRAAVLYTRFLKPFPQPPERVARYAMLLQRQNKVEEAMEQYTAAAEMFLGQQKSLEALGCWEKLAQLDPDNLERHLKLGEAGEQLKRPELASRGYFRAAQLALADAQLERALELYGRAHGLAPSDRSVCLFYAEALLRAGDAARAVALLEPVAPGEHDAPFLAVFGEALLHDGQLDRARGVLEQVYREKPDGFAKLFELAGRYVQAGQAETGVEILSGLRQRLAAAGRQNEWLAELDRVGEAHPQALPLAEFCAGVYNELNREAKYFDWLTRLFELYLAAGNLRGACDALDRLIDIDPYDSGHLRRRGALEGKADPEYLRGLQSRLSQAAGLTTGVAIGQDAHAAGQAGAESGEQSLDDLIVQAEIFFQYGLGAKVVERLQHICELFPHAAHDNERLLRLCEQVNWWPAGVPRPAAAAPVAAAAPANPETMRDLAKISEITRLVYRQATPKAVLSAAVNEIGKYLRVARCLAVVGTPGQPPQVAAEYCAPGVEPAVGAHLAQLLAELERAAPDASGARLLEGAAVPVLGELGLATVLAVQLTDKESQAPAGMLAVAHAVPAAWKPTEAYLLETVGDQMLISVNHTRLRSLVRNLAVADERTGLLGRSSYADCLLAESNRAKRQGSPLSLVLFQVDRGSELIRQQGEAAVEHYVEQLARTLQPAVRQNDLAVKYTAWALAFILPDTTLEDATTLAEKLRGLSGGVRPQWNSGGVTFSAAVVEAVTRADYDSEDIVTDMINRAEFALDEARSKGGDRVVPLENLRI